MKKTLKNKGFWIGIAAMASVVTISNITVAYPINNWLTWAAFVYPLAFLVTDLNNRILGTSIAQKVILFGFGLGVVFSIVFADVRIALASGTAFLVAQLLDVLIFNKLRKSAWWRAPLISSVVASAVDTALFFSLAFVGTGVPWITLGTGDYFAKLAMAVVLLVPFRYIYKKFNLTEKV